METSDWIRYVFTSSFAISAMLHFRCCQGGDSGTGEWPLMAMDYLLWTNDSEAFLPYLKLPVQVYTLPRTYRAQQYTPQQ